MAANKTIRLGPTALTTTTTTNIWNPPPSDSSTPRVNSGGGLSGFGSPRCGVSGPATACSVPVHGTHKGVAKWG